jgi:hypothetical protein
MKIGDTITVGFVTSDGTGAAADALALPVGVLLINGAADAASVDIVNTGTGLYIASVVLPAFSVGDVLQIRVSASLTSGDGSSVTAVGIVWQSFAIEPPGGSDSIVVTVTSGGNPLQGAHVRIVAADGSTIDAKTTGASGIVTLYADPDDWTLVTTHPRHTSDSRAITLPDDATAAVSLTAVTIPVSDDPTVATAYARVYDDGGEIEAGVTVTLQSIETVSGDTGRIYSGRKREAVSDADGVVSWVRLPVGSRVKYWRGGADETRRKIREETLLEASVEDGAFALPSIIGSEEV